MENNIFRARNLIIIFASFAFAISNINAAFSADQTFYWEIKPDISVGVLYPNLTVGVPQNISITVGNNNNYSAAGNLTVKIGRKSINSTTFEYPESWVVLNLTEVIVENGTYRIVWIEFADANLTEGQYKALAKFYYNGTYTTAYALFDVYAAATEPGNNTGNYTNETNNTAPDVPIESPGGDESEIMITADIAKEANFGDSVLIDINMSFGMHTGKDFRIVSYISGPKKISADTEGDTLYKNYCYSDTAFEIKNASNIRAIIPVLLKPNCNREYSDGLYNLTTRVCEKNGESWNYTDVALKGSIYANYNEAKSRERCKKEKETVYKTVTERSILIVEKNCTGYNNNTKGNETEQNYAIENIPDAVIDGERFNIIVKARNSYNESFNFSAYSYIYNSDGIHSAGFDGDSWKKTWDANRNTFEIKSNETYYFSLESIALMNSSNSSHSKLKVKIYLGGKLEKAIEKEIYIIAKDAHDEINVSCSYTEKQIRAKIKNNFVYGEKLHAIYLTAGSLSDKEIELKRGAETEIFLNMVNGENAIIIYSNSRFFRKCSATKNESTGNSRSTGLAVYNDKQKTSSGIFDKIKALITRNNYI